MFYFAYGSNLDPQQMSRRCPGYTTIGLAELRDHKLTFPLTSHDWGGGVASVGVAHGETMWGAVYDLSDDDLAALDHYEHFLGSDDQHNVYDRETTSVELVRADDGSFPRRLQVWIYVARQANPSPPSRRYLDVVLSGARHHRLPDDYVEQLAAIPVAG